MNKQKVPLQRPKTIDLAKLRQIDYFGLQLVVPDQVYGPMEDTDLSIKFLRKWLIKHVLILNDRTFRRALKKDAYKISCN